MLTDPEILKYIHTHMCNLNTHCDVSAETIVNGLVMYAVIILRDDGVTKEKAIAGMIEHIETVYSDPKYISNKENNTTSSE